CARPARSDPGVDGQIHKKTAANGVRVISGHAGAGAESWGVTLLVDGRYQEGTTGRDVYESQEVH
ncbi:hypothetical protein, partial [Microbacterium lacticum]|uniref:hypothetical protein n=1 Tax=Microbacterium lacticum TaxID=33885 RepID=UPI0019D56270